MRTRNRARADSQTAPAAARALLAAELGRPAEPVDWHAVHAIPADERLGALLYALGREQGAPAAALAALRPAWLAFRRQYLLGVSDLHALLDGFESDGVAVVPLKGPALGELLYRDPTTRAFTDLDLYVAAADADRAATLLRRLGYRHLAHERGLAYERRWAGAACFVPAAGSPRTLPVDLHWSLLAFPGGTVPGGYDDLQTWPGARRVEGLGRAMRQLAAEDLVLYLALHLAIHHGGGGLGWRLDLALALHRWADALSWEHVAARARAWGVAGGVYFALRSMEAALGYAAPSAARAALRTAGPRARLLDALATSIRPRPRLGYVVALLSLDLAVDRRRVLRRLLAPPSEWLRDRYGATSATRGRVAHYRRLVGLLHRRSA